MVLDIRQNAFSKLPESLLALPRLTTLALEANPLGGMPPEVLAAGCAAVLQFLSRQRASRLHHNLDLSNLALQTIPPDVLSMAALQELSLADNLLTSLPPSLPYTLSSLTRLSLASNRLAPPLPPSLIKLAPTLTSLDLSHNRLSHLPAALFGLTRLK